MEDLKLAIIAWEKQLEAKLAGEKDLATQLHCKVMKHTKLLSEKQREDFEYHKYLHRRRARNSVMAKAYVLDEPEGEVYSYQVAYEKAFEKAEETGQRVLIYEGRKATDRDFFIRRLRRGLKEALKRLIEEHEEFSTDDGGPVLMKEGLDVLLDSFLGELIDENVDMSSTALIDTRWYKWVYPDGSTELIEED